MRLFTAFSLFAGSIWMAVSLIVNPYTPDAIAQSPTPTPQNADYIYAILLDNNALLYCSIIRQPIDPIFQTATAIASQSPTATATRTPTRTSTPLATHIIPPTPTQEFAVTASPVTVRMTVQIAAINVRNAASLTAPIQYVVTQGQLLNVTPNTVINSGYVWRQLSDGFWMVEKNLSNGQVWLQ